MYSTSCSYAIRAVLYLAQQRDDKKCGAKELSARLDIPYHFIAKIMQELARKDVVSSTKGPRGGFFLTVKQRRKNLLSIVELIDGSSWNKGCTLGLDECNPKRPCPVHDLVTPLRKQLETFLKTSTIDEVAGDLNKGRIFIGAKE